MVTTAFFLERRNAVRPITMLKMIGPKKKEKIDTTRGSTVVGSKDTTSRYLSKRRIARTKFSKMEYINGPVRITKMFLQYKANTNPKVIKKRLTMPLQRDRATSPAVFQNSWWWSSRASACSRCRTPDRKTYCSCPLPFCDAAAAVSPAPYQRPPMR